MLPGPIQLDKSDAPGDRYVVETLVDKKATKKEIKYLVKWQGWLSDYNEWVNKEDIDKSLVDDFEKSKSMS